ncbi:hypothetical protein CJA_1019 [Cellvibrio japonicus Ueda107]|uniref:Uncharacterized protein n=1 Tax=Cellvibrio japonicus (strain Ueda107) TaxID=498211 RepID=B3PB48_CELJU|nr:hypothetical protein CJA_1019 [Cellvibrio japonicus Ueda107]
MMQGKNLKLYGLPQTIAEVVFNKQVSKGMD